MQITRLAAVAALAALGLSAPAHAQLTQFQSASQLGANDGALSFTGSGSIASPFSQTASGDTLTFTALNGATFYLQQADGTNFDFAAGTNLLETAAPAGADGPLNIDFSQGITEFGLNAQDYAPDTEMFSVAAFNGTTPLGGFFVGPADNSSDLGTALFLGGSIAPGQTITRLQIASYSSEAGAANDFLIGPVAFAPVPEASTSVGFGILLALGGLALAKRQRTVLAK